MKPGEAEQGRRDDAQWRKDARRRKNRKTRRSEGEERAFLVSRANSIFDSASRHSRLRQGSKIDYSSITLRLSYPLPFLLLGSLTCLLLLLLFLSPSSFTSSSSASSGGSLPLLPSVQLPRPLLSSLSSPCPPGPIGPGIPSQASSGLVSSLSLLCYRVLISEPLGFTWRALMTSRNERVPPSSNKRLFHVPMLILQESRRFQPSPSFFLPSQLSASFSFLVLAHVSSYEMEMCAKRYIRIYRRC